MVSGYGNAVQMKVMLATNQPWIVCFVYAKYSEHNFPGCCVARLARYVCENSLCHCIRFVYCCPFEFMHRLLYLSKFQSIYSNALWMWLLLTQRFQVPSTKYIYIYSDGWSDWIVYFINCFICSVCFKEWMTADVAVQCVRVSGANKSKEQSSWQLHLYILSKS